MQYRYFIGRDRCRDVRVSYSSSFTFVSRYVYFWCDDGCAPATASASDSYHCNSVTVQYRCVALLQTAPASAELTDIDGSSTVGTHAMFWLVSVVEAANCAIFLKY